MGVIRLSVIALVGIGGAMYYFGDGESVPADPIGRETALLPAMSLPALIEAEVEPEKPVADGSALNTALAADASPETPTVILASTETDAVEEPTLVLEAQPEATVAPDPVPDQLAMLYITGSRVNVRGGPSTAYGVISSLTYGTGVEDMGDAGDGWRAIRLMDTGEVGYMSGQFLSEDAP